MTRKTPYYTSDDLIEAIKRKISFPTSQNTYEDEDLLSFCNEELILNQVPSVMQFHEEFFVHTEDEALVTNQLKYQVPDRAIGRKLRDIQYVDTNGNEYELTQINLDDRSHFVDTYSSGTLNKFYFQGDEIVLIANPSSLVGYLRYSYYLRPNQLVTNDRAAIAKYFVKTITVDNTTLTSGDVFSIGDETFIAGTDFAIGATSIITATNLSTAITNSGIVSSSSNGNPSTAIITVKYRTLSLEFTTTNEDAFSIQQSQGIEFENIPDNIAEGSKVDFLQTKRGHKTLGMSVEIPESSLSLTTINFNSSDVPSNFAIGDYICSEYECIIPQLPDDVHPALVERVCQQILSSIGDMEGVKEKGQSIRDIEVRQGILLDNRGEGSPQKVNNVRSFVKLGKRRRFSRR